MSNFSNSTGFTDLFVAANTTSEGYLVWSIIIVLPLILYFYTAPYGKWRALTYATFINTMVILVFNIAGLAEYWIHIFNLILFSFGFWMLIHSKGKTS